MARTTKKGIDYSPWDVNIFDGDPKIDKLLEAQGCAGFVVYFYLCQMAYKFEGYYYTWSCDDAATTAKRVGGGVGSETVRQTVALCLQTGLFEKRLFDRYGVLTSRGIQARFLEATTRRVGNSVIEEYWLLEKEISNGLVFRTLFENCCNNNDDSCNKKGDSCGNNSIESKVEKSKGKKRTEESGGCAAGSSSSDSVLDIQPEKPEDRSPATAFYMDHINGTPSEISRTELLEFERDVGSEVCIRAMEIALDARKTSWNYIRGILKNKRRDGIRSLADWDAAEAQRDGKGKPDPFKMPVYEKTEGSL